MNLGGDTQPWFPKKGPDLFLMAVDRHNHVIYTSAYASTMRCANLSHVPVCVRVLVLESGLVLENNL